MLGDILVSTTKAFCGDIVEQAHDLIEHKIQHLISGGRLVEVGFAHSTEGALCARIKGLQLRNGGNVGSRIGSRRVGKDRRALVHKKLSDPNTGKNTGEPVQHSNRSCTTTSTT